MINNLTGVQTTSRIKQFKKSNKIAISTAFVLVLIVVLFLLVNSTNSKTNSQIQQPAQKVQLAKPVSSQVINRSFDFPILDANGKQISTIKYLITTVEMRDEIIVKGQKVAPIDGKTFLVINLELTNTYQKDIQINSRDYLRVVVNNAQEHLAPDIHNDPVDVQAISTEPTRLALALDTSAKNLVLQVGQIQGSKTSIPLTLQYK